MEKFETELLEKVPQAPNIFSYRFSNPIQLEFQAGQYIFLSVTKDKKVLSHPFSLSNSPTEGDYLEVTTIVRESEYKKRLHDMKPGDPATIKGPAGQFTLTQGIEKIGMLSGGIGITPLRSICKYCTDKQLNVNIILLYGNITMERIAFKKDLETMQAKNPHLKVIHTIEKPTKDWQGYTGYIDTTMIQKEIPDYPQRTYYTCGPPAMLQAMKNLLSKLSIPKEHIRTENFAGYMK